MAYDKYPMGKEKPSKPQPKPKRQSGLSIANGGETEHSADGKNFKSNPDHSTKY